MSLENLPYDVFFLILQGLRDDCYETYIETVRELRLTSRSLSDVATGFLFESFYLYASNPYSWMKMKKLRKQIKLVEYVRVLVVKRDFRFGHYIQDSLDLTSMPNLQEIIIKFPVALLFHLQRRHPVKNPGKSEHRILLSLDPFRLDRETRWVRFISDLVNCALAHSYELDLLRIDLYKPMDRSFWLNILPTIDLRYVRTLSLRTNWDFDSADQKLMGSIILPALRSMPSLVRLILRQRKYKGTKYSKDCDLVSMLQNYHWPSVRNMMIIEPTTTLTTFRNFLSLYRSQLERLALYGEFPKMTIEELYTDCIEQSEISSDDNYDDAISKWDRKCGGVLQAWVKQKITPERFTVDSLQTWDNTGWDRFPIR